MSAAYFYIEYRSGRCTQIEFKTQAEEAHAKAIATLEQLHAGAIAQEKAAAEEAARHPAMLARLAESAEIRRGSVAVRQALC